ncbi:MAG: UDP-N-acetylmuramyl-tripeptide synthetase [Candidatus Kaiserbacteria bacterium]|nr:UDP-N-acetylmuramyl-tripeptide synthetase [Candidatus Kaiserbacteria bacterium]MCB9816479.1 UDP-N-acetylmuramyl-tripeptide synthetase [Candidatus Nomurabacteria bacterium]
MDTARQLLKRIIPKRIFTFLQPYYHYLLSYIGATRYHHPSREIVVIGVTGTKGKSSVTEILTHILRTDGKKVASLSTIQFSIGDTTERNLYKMTMPGRFFVQKFLREAVDAGCTHAVVEMTSEGAKQYRHKFVDIDALIFTNLAPEHIESHGSFENYKNAKLSIAAAVADSPKRPRYIVANIDNEHGADFLNFDIEHNLPYSLKDLSLYTLHKDSVSMVFGDTTVRVPLVGLFNVYNSLAAITLARAFGVSLDTIQKAFRTLPPLRGRVEHFASPKDAAKQVTAVVDYAHTPDSLTQFYEAFPDKYKVCVLGNTGGGRDTWKRPEMGAIAEKYCNQVILTNEDPYDEDPEKIITEMQKGMQDDAHVEVIMDRREAIARALELTPQDGYTLISGKGTDPYIMGPNDTKTPWSDAEVVQELLAELPKATQ